jgi:hypothetical protein
VGDTTNTAILVFREHYSVWTDCKTGNATEKSVRNSLFWPARLLACCPPFGLAAFLPQA